MADQRLSELVQIGGSLVSSDEIYMQRSGTSYKVLYSTIISSHTHDLDEIPDAGSYVKMTSTERTKLAGIADGATSTESIPAGTVTMYAGSSAPTGWLLCDGDLKSTTTFADLFAAIGYTYGGTGATFALPDMQSRFPLGVGSGSGLTTRNLADNVGGVEEHELDITEIPEHTHGLTVDRDVDDSPNDEYSIKEYDGSDNRQTGPAGGGQPHNNMPPFLALNFIIKT